MGRMKYTEEERSRIMISFIQATRKIIDTEGIDQVSIRKIANQTGMNSATMYLYFSNADVLITMASMGYLEKYCRTLAADMAKMTSKPDKLPLPCRRTKAECWGASFNVPSIAEQTAATPLQPQFATKFKAA